jgi:hypothetical protein
LHGMNGFPFQQWSQVALEDFDFRQFRHGKTVTEYDVLKKMCFGNLRALKVGINPVAG